VLLYLVLLPFSHHIFYVFYNIWATAGCRMFTFVGKTRLQIVSRQPKQWSRVVTRCPQKRGQVRRVRITTPRKPNSARRKTVKLKITNKKTPVSYIRGIGHTLKRFSTVLIMGKGARDLPGVYSRCIRGKFDLAPLYLKKRRRSIYGMKKTFDL